MYSFDCVLLTYIVYEGLGMLVDSQILKLCFIKHDEAHIRLASVKCMWKDCCYNDGEWIIVAVEHRRRVHRYCSITV